MAGKKRKKPKKAAPTSQKSEIRASNAYVIFAIVVAVLMALTLFAPLFGAGGHGGF